MFRRLMTFDEARRVIGEKLKLNVLGEEEIPLLEACNRVLGENIVSALNIPSFSKSTVDGYAVKAEDTYGAEENQPAKLTTVGIVNIGEKPKISIGKGETVEIVTGAPIPKGADAVVMVENTDRQDSELHVFRAVTRDENVMKYGQDIKKGDTVLKTGQILNASDIGVLAALGFVKVKVFKIPMVAVLSTGAEITEPGEKLLDGKIYDINAYSLSIAVQESNGKPIYLGVVQDDKVELRKALKHALASADMVITSGGVSVGPKDLTPQVVNSLGKPGVIINGIAVKPGKPTTIALVGRKPVICLPGHPTSALLMFYLIARPIIQSMSGRPTSQVKTVKALASRRMFSARGRRTFVMVKLNPGKSSMQLAEPVETGASGAITTLAKADGFISIPENHQFIDTGEEVIVTILNEAS